MHIRTYMFARVAVRVTSCASWVWPAVPARASPVGVQGRVGGRWKASGESWKPFIVYAFEDTNKRRKLRKWRHGPSREGHAFAAVRGGFTQS